MASLLGFLGALGDSFGVGSPDQPNALTRLNNAADPVAAAQRQEAVNQQSVLAKLADLRQQGVTDPQKILSSLATVSPDYAAKAAEIQAKNPLATAFSSFQPTAGPAAPGAPAQPTEDPYALKPESPDDKRNYDFLNTKVPPQYRALVRQISNGDESVGNADSLRSNGLLSLAAMFDPSLNKTDFTARQATAKAFSQGGKSGQFITSANTGTKHLAQVALDAIDLHNSNNVAGNWFRNLYSKYVKGQDPTTNFSSDVSTVAPELDKAATGGGDTTEGGTKRQLESFNVNASPEQQLGAIAGKVDLIQSKAEEVGNSYKNDMGGRQKKIISPENQKTLKDLKDLHQFAKDGKLDSPEAQAVIGRLRKVVGGQETKTASAPQSAQAPASAQSIAEGATATNSKTGEKIVYRGGKWQPLQ